MTNRTATADATARSNTRRVSTGGDDHNPSVEAFSSNRATSCQPTSEGQRDTTGRATRVPQLQALARSVARRPAVPRMSEQSGFRFGIDKLAVKFALDGFDQTFSGWKVTPGWFGPPDDRRRMETYQFWQWLPGRSQVYIAVTWQEHRDPVCEVRFNPSRLLDPYGTALAPVRSLPALLRMLIYEVLPELHLRPVFDMPLSHGWLAPDPMSWVKVLVIHIARDFIRLQQTEAYTRLALTTPVKDRAKKKPVFNAKTGRLETVTVGNKSGEVSVYDKYLESRAKKRGDPASPGTLRVEARLNQPWVNRFGLTSLDLVTPDAVEAVFHDRFLWVGLAAPVAGATTILAKIAAQTSLTPISRALLAGHLAGRTQQVDLGLSIAVQRRLDRELASLGYAIGDPLESDSRRESRLDLATGTEQLRSSNGRWITRTPRDTSSGCEGSDHRHGFL